MRFYKICDSVVRSDVELPELEETVPQAAAFSIYLRPTPDAIVSRSMQSTRVGLELHAWPHVSRAGTTFQVIFPGLAEFEFAADEQTIRGYPIGEVPPVTMRHLLLDQVMPIVSSHRAGRVVLHASAIEVDGRAIAFVGQSGWGKSSLAGSFYRDGFALVTDDFLVVEQGEWGFRGFPSYPALRLWSEAITALMTPSPGIRPMAHYSDKKWLPLRDASELFSYSAVPIGQVCLLSPAGSECGTSIRIEPVASHDAVVHLTQCLFRLDPHDRDKLREEFVLLGQLVSSVPVFRLSYPRSYACMPAVREAVLDTLQGRLDRRPCDALPASSHV